MSPLILRAAFATALRDGSSAAMLTLASVCCRQSANEMSVWGNRGRNCRPEGVMDLPRYTRCFEFKGPLDLTICNEWVGPWTPSFICFQYDTRTSPLAQLPRP